MFIVNMMFLQLRDRIWARESGHRPIVRCAPPYDCACGHVFRVNALRRRGRRFGDS